ncbi:MAG: hypothetical protein AUJ97_05930 [Bacteroidetes bacterium CG2_30_32_10]|nr:MAG: hypothetical protein AUJ97_05930 [Bacteroidetes bacterium CG2_30_32_10]
MNAKKLTFGFYLMSCKGFEVLKIVLENIDANQIKYVVSSKDINVEKDWYNEIKSLTEKNNIVFYNAKEKFNDNVTYRFAISWKWIIPDVMNLIIIHDSLLPKYRGFSPIVTALLNEDTTIGATALFANESYDTGPIIFQKSLTIKYPIKLIEVFKSISLIYCEIVLHIINRLNEKADLQVKVQDNKEATYSLWRDDFDYLIDWRNSSTYNKRFIDSIGFPYKGASTYMNNELIRIYDATEIEDVNIEIRDIGKVVFIKDGFPVVVCNKGLLLLKEAVFEETKKSIFPIKNVRTRFKTHKYDYI